jgi:DNA-directed RNA polymerase specialized sigma24 family protein
MDVDKEFDDGDDGFSEPRQALLHALANGNEWEVIDQVDGFCWIFDRLPDKMRIIVDLRMSNVPDEEISAMMGIKVQSVKNRLVQAKKRFMKAIL